jgi:hypothetical protein
MFILHPLHGCREREADGDVSLPHPPLLTPCVILADRNFRKRYSPKVRLSS